MRLLVCAGGTGGGIYPALSVLQALEPGEAQVLWVGGEGGMEVELVTRSGIDFTAIPAAGLHGVGLRALPGNLSRLVAGYFAARKVLCDFKPDVLFFTGGYVAVPVALAGREVPSLLYVPDVEPGLALKTLSRFADQIALIAEESRQYFQASQNTMVTGHPTRNDLQSWTREQALDFFQLSRNLPVLLVFGGSLGARSINRAVLSILEEVLPDLQIIHISGQLDWAEVQTAQNNLAPNLADRYRPTPYLYDEMGAAYAAADLILSRSGASAVGEIPLFGCPAILVPYPHAWRYQRVNADFLSRHGGAVVLEDNTLPTRLLPVIRELMADQERREQMGAAMRALARFEASATLAASLRDLAHRVH